MAHQKVARGAELAVAWREDGEREAVDGNVLRRREKVEDEEELRERVDVGRAAALADSFDDCIVYTSAEAAE